MSDGINSEFLDKSMDDALERVEGLNWLPWVGASYRDTDKRLMILGESTYNRGKTHNERMIAEKRLDDKNNLRRIHEKYALTGKGESKFARNLEKAICRKKRVSKDERESFWSSVIYHNLVLEVMPRLKVRPKYTHYKKGWEVFLQLSHLADIDKCIVYGTEMSKVDSLVDALKQKGVKFSKRKLATKVGRVYPRRVNFELGGKVIEVLFIRHPSAFFSWKGWGGVIQSELGVNGRNYCV